MHYYRFFYRIELKSKYYYYNNHMKLRNVINKNILCTLLINILFTTFSTEFINKQ
jgi:hypothetical protein